MKEEKTNNVEQTTAKVLVNEKTIELTDNSYFVFSYKGKDIKLDNNFIDYEKAIDGKQHKPSLRRNEKTKEPTGRLYFTTSNGEVYNGSCVYNKVVVDYVQSFTKDTGRQGSKKRQKENFEDYMNNTTLKDINEKMQGVYILAKIEHDLKDNNKQALQRFRLTCKKYVELEEEDKGLLLDIYNEEFMKEQLVFEGKKERLAKIAKYTSMLLEFGFTEEVAKEKAIEKVDKETKEAEDKANNHEPVSK